MRPEEIRALRGALSRAAFARQLDVTPLTVHRWELADGHPEARRPRGKILERLQQLAAGARPTDDGSSPIAVTEEPVEEEGAPARSPLLEPQQADDAFAREEALLTPLLEQSASSHWEPAELALLRMLEVRALTTRGGRALASLGLALVQFNMRFDVHGARMTWAPVAEDAEDGELPPSVAARAYVVGALLFTARYERSFDPARAAGYIARAEALLREGDRDSRVYLLRARIAATRFVDPRVGIDAYRAHASEIEGARTAVAQFYAVTLRGFAAHSGGDEEAAARYAVTTRSMARHMRLFGVYLALLTDRAHRMQRGAFRPDAILDVCREVREQMRGAHIRVSESFLVALGAEVEALSRAGRMDEAAAVAREALDAAATSGVGAYPFAARVARLYVMQARVPELPALADRLERETGAAPRDVHVLQIRALHSGLTGDYAAAAQIGEEICRAPAGAVGLVYVVHDAYVELVYARLLLRDLDGATEALGRFDALLRERPSVWHSAMAMRLQGYLFMQQGRLAEARQKFEATVATFGVLGDVLQVQFSRGSLALVARAGGKAEDGEVLLRSTITEVERFSKLAPELYARGQGLMAPVTPSAWQEPTLAERLVVAVERMTVGGLSAGPVLSELGSILGEVFPERQVILDPEQAVEGVDDAIDVRDVGRLAIRGALDPGERAAMRLLALIVPMVRGTEAQGTFEEVAVDAVLPGFVAAAPATRRLKAEVAQLSRSSATILIDGESGSGKEVVARAVHDLSTRSQHPYVVFNCASVPTDLFESQLFGHRRGSFTGATHDNLGVIRAAEGGTLFLDEIAELPLATQPKLLRFLENGEVLPIGEQKARRVDVRIIAATHRDLGVFMREGRFREDLFYRLNVVPLRVPPLRDRKEDVLALARLFISRLVPEGSAPPNLAPDAVSALMAYRWPGNVRELRNTIERAMAYTPIPPVLRARDLRFNGAASSS